MNVSLAEGPIGTLEASLALVGAICGGVMLEVVRRFLTHPDRTRDDRVAMRDELRRDNKELRDELQRLVNRANAWEERYYQLQEDYLAYREIIASRVGSELAERIRGPAEELGARRRAQAKNVDG